MILGLSGEEEVVKGGELKKGKRGEAKPKGNPRPRIRI